MATKTKPALAGGDAHKTIETALFAGKDTVETVMKAGVDAAQKSLEHAVQLAKNNVEKASTAFFKGYDELSVYSKGNVEAVVKAGSIYARGMEDLSKTVMAITQAQLEASVAAAKAVLGCTSLRQMVDLQTDLARSHFDKVMADGSKLSEISLKVANEALEPIQARVNVAVEKFTKPAA
ncbi:MAG: phasin family protein [Proteobacteria bacterium]|nr:phasin family protein [Pseudomonadota bacterium]